MIFWVPWIRLPKYNMIPENAKQVNHRRSQSPSQHIRLRQLPISTKLSVPGGRWRSAWSFSIQVLLTERKAPKLDWDAGIEQVEPASATAESSSQRILDRIHADNGQRTWAREGRKNWPINLFSPRRKARKYSELLLFTLSEKRIYF